MLSKKASSLCHGEDSSYFHGWQKYDSDRYDKLTNPKGIIQMGLAENQLSFDLLESWLASNPDALVMKRPNGESAFTDLALFQDYHGSADFKNKLVNFMARIRENKVNFKPDNLVLTAGSTSANEILMFCLADPGEAFLLPTPYYAGLSKDLGLPGFRVGMIYSNNETVVSAATKMSSFGLVSSQTQFLLANMLSDMKFTDKYMKENKERLKKRKETLVSGLKLAGINYLESNAGLFCWVDMSHLLVSNTFDAEKELWEQIIEEAKLNISPGSSFHCTEPGWFRICFANMCAETIQVALKRLKDFSQSINSKKKAGSCSRQRRFLLGKWVSMLLPYDPEPDR
ncbi:hypothetical protein Patl1_08769 [Pistacia atlantica]|uniref:Uncharacterized protein n=1 Tax=Pistacia atlantica TaxID=434234 RepID=A0ACC1AE42_9ROSI|nr:hypothetical protein Patl1_08769 [Pistacia atlantica]